MTLAGRAGKCSGWGSDSKGGEFVHKEGLARIEGWAHTSPQRLALKRHLKNNLGALNNQRRQGGVL